MDKNITEKDRETGKRLRVEGYSTYEISTRTGLPEVVVHEIIFGTTK